MTHTRIRIALGSDHGGSELKEAIKIHLNESRSYIDVIDFGTHDTHSVDYPDVAQAVASSIVTEEVDIGILCCGTGIGVSMAANRLIGIRAALVFDAFTAEMAKAHNNANILCLGGRTTEPETACRLVDIWLDTDFEGGRHDRRLIKLDLN